MITYKNFALRQMNEEYMDEVMECIRDFIKDQFPTISIKIYKKDFPNMIEDDLLEFKKVLFDACGKRISSIKITKQINKNNEEFYLIYICKKDRDKNIL